MISLFGTALKRDELLDVKVFQLLSALVLYCTYMASYTYTYDYVYVVATWKGLLFSYSVNVVLL